MIKAVLLEGEAAEISAALEHFMSGGRASKEAKAILVESQAEDDDPSEYVGSEVAKLALTRIKLAPHQKLLLRTLVESHPNYVSANDLMQKLGQSSPQFRGFMGAFGRRFSYTEGWGEGEEFFDQHWDHEAGCYQYRLPDHILDVVKECRVLD